MFNFNSSDLEFAYYYKGFIIKPMSFNVSAPK